MQNEFEQARREFILKTGMGLGWLSLAELLGTPAWAQQSPIPGRRARRPAGLPALRAEGQARDLSAHARRVLAERHLRLQADAREDARRGAAGVGHGQPAALDDGQGADVVSDRRPGLEVQAVRQERDDGQRCDAARRRHRRRHLPDQDDEHGARQPRPGVEVPAHRLPDRGTAVGRRVGDLRARVREQGPADVRRHELGQLRRRADRRLDLGGRLHAVALSGRAVPLRPGTGAVHRGSEGADAEGSPRDARRDRPSRERAARRESSDPEIPSKISQYEMAYRMQQSVPEIADISKEPEHVLDLYGPAVRQTGTFARNCLLARRLAERNVRYTMVVQMGWDHHGGISHAAAGGLSRCRSADGGSHHRSEAARAARRHAGGLRHRVRADVVRAGDAQDQLRPRSSRRQLLRLHGGRRRRRPGSRTARPTTSATTSSRIPCTFTI